MSVRTQLVLETLLEDPTRERYSREIGRAAGLPPGAVYPVLAKMEAVGWLRSRWEDLGPDDGGRSARRYYRMDAMGAVEARRALAAAGRSSGRVAWGTSSAGQS